MPTAGRRPGNPDTRSDVLAAAREVFGEVGYDRATIRGIARRAGVDPALVHHYFGTKESLYAASIELSMVPGEVLAAVLAGGSDGLGDRLARGFFGVWELEAPRHAFLGMLRGAIGGDDQAVRAFREFVVGAIKARLVEALEGPDRDERALAMASQLVGLAIVRYVVRIEPFASAEVDDLVALVGPRLQSYADAP